MYQTKAAFDYIRVGGRCAYETNKAFVFPEQQLYATNSLYSTEHDGIRCDFMDTSSYLEVLFNTAIDSDKFYMLRLVYYVKNISNLNLKVTWKKEGSVDFCTNCKHEVGLGVSGDKFLYVDIDLRQNSEWVGRIKNIRIGVSNSEIVPLFVKYFSIYSPTVYSCSRPSCPYYNKYTHPCDAGRDSHMLSGKYFDGNSIELETDSSFLFSVYNIDFVIKFESNTYFLDIILEELNNFFDNMPIPHLKIIKDGGCIKLTCDYVRPFVTHTELSEKLGFFNSDGSEAYTYSIDSGGVSDYIDIGGNLKGVYTVSDLKDLNFSKVFAVGFSDDDSLYPESSFEFVDKTVIFHTLTVLFDGYLNCFEIYCKALSGGGKILLYRRDGDTYKVVNVYSLTEETKMSKHILDWICTVYKGDVLGFYNLKIGISKTISGPVNYYGEVSGYSNSVNKSDVEEVSFSSVSFYAYFKQPTTNSIPILATYDEVAYVDKMSFSLEYDETNDNYFNVMLNNVFNCEVTDCHINVKDDQDIITTISGSVVGENCLSDGVFFSDEYGIDSNTYNDIPPIDLDSIRNTDVLRYSWNKYIIDMYEAADYTYTSMPGSVFFYYEFPTCIDIHKVLLYSIEDNMVDKYLLRILDNTKQSPSFSNQNDIINLNYQIDNWAFNLSSGDKTKGLGIFVYNYKSLVDVSFSEIEICTKIGSTLKYVIDVTTITTDDYVVPIGIDINGNKNNVCVANHVKSLVINVGFVSDDKSFDFNNIGVYSSYVPDDYFVSDRGSGEGTVTIYNTRLKALKCYLLDYGTKAVNSLIYEYDFDNAILYKGFIPTKHTHEQFYFTSSNYTNSEYNTYMLKNMLNTESFFVVKSYQFNRQEYDDWYAPYDYIIPGNDGEFVYVDGALKLIPIASEAIRWFNYINTNEFYNDIDIELRFDYVGSMEGFVFIGLTCCDRDYNNYLKFYSAYQTSSCYGLEYQLSGDSDPTYYDFTAPIGRNSGLKIKKRGNIWTFYCFYSDNWHELTTFTLFDSEILISISTLFNSPSAIGNVIAELTSCDITASKMVAGKKVWYTINDGLDYIYSGNVLDNLTILDNLNKDLTFSREYTIKKFVYNFTSISMKYFKLVNTTNKSVKITEIKCYLHNETVPIEQSYTSYSDDLFFGTLVGETVYLDDGVIINPDLSEEIRKGGDDVLSAVGVDFGKVVAIDKVVVYYVNETGSYESPYCMYGYDNIVYYDVYDNFSLFSKNTHTTLHCLFNEFSGYKGKNEITYDLVSNDQYNSYFSEEGVQDHKWSIESPYVVDSGGVWLKHLTGAESITSKFSIDGDFIIDLYFDSFSDYSNQDSRLYFSVLFENDTYYSDEYVYQNFISDQVITRQGSISIEINRTWGGLRIKRVGSVFYRYYREYGTTWSLVSSYNYGSDYIYPVRIQAHLYGSYAFNVRLEKILIIEGTGISDTDFELLESQRVNTLFISGRQFSDDSSYALVKNSEVTDTTYPFSFSLLHNVASSIPYGGFLVGKPYVLGFAYSGNKLFLSWFSEYFTQYLTDDVLVYSDAINSVASLSVSNYNIDNYLFTSTSDSSIKAIYKSRYDTNSVIDETFKTGEGTFDKTHEDINCQPGYLFDGFTAVVSGSMVSSDIWVVYNTSHSSIKLTNDSLYFYFYDSVSPEYAKVISTYKILSDFDMFVDFTVCSGINSNRCGLGLVFEIDEDNRTYIKAGYDSGEVFMCGTTVSGVVTGFNTTRSGTYGKTRITRVNDNVTVYYKDGDVSNWTEFHSFPVFPVDCGRISLGLYSADSPGPCGYFDNFTLNTTSDVNCQPGILSDSFTGVDDTKANVDDWTTYDTDHGNVRIKDNKLHFSFSV